MNVIFENKFHLTEESLNMPFMSGNLVVGVISEINEEIFNVMLFDKFIGCEMVNNKVSAVYISHHEQMLWEEFINIYSDKFINNRSKNGIKMDIDLIKNNSKKQNERVDSK